MAAGVVGAATGFSHIHQPNIYMVIQHSWCIDSSVCCRSLVVQSKHLPYMGQGYEVLQLPLQLQIGTLLRMYMCGSVYSNIDASINVCCSGLIKTVPRVYLASQ